MAKRRRRSTAKCKCVKWSKKSRGGKRRCLKRTPKGCTPRKK